MIIFTSVCGHNCNFYQSPSSFHLYGFCFRHLWYYLELLFFLNIQILFILSKLPYHAYQKMLPSVLYFQGCQTLNISVSSKTENAWYFSTFMVLISNSLY